VTPKADPDPKAPPDPLPAEGGDSLWMLCSSALVALNSFEHRSEDGAGRNTDYVLIYGGNTLTGTVVDGADDVSMKGINGDNSTFTGKVTFDANNGGQVQGTLTLLGTPFTVAETLKCTGMGHP
jgi:hypothetical protein